VEKHKAALVWITKEKKRLEELDKKRGIFANTTAMIEIGETCIRDRTTPCQHIVTAYDMCGDSCNMGVFTAPIIAEMLFKHGQIDKHIELSVECWEDGVMKCEQEEQDGKEKFNT
jgi:hypothetical protein